MAEASCSPTDTGAVANIIQMINCKGIQIGDGNNLIVSKEANDIIKAGSCDNVTHLTKNEIGKLLIKLCFESSQSDTLSYDELFKQLQTQMI